MAKSTFLVLFFAACSTISDGHDCGSPFPPKGEQHTQFDFSECSPFREMWTPTIDFCRDRCLTSDKVCKSFSFNCKEDSKYNCRLFELTWTQLSQQDLLAVIKCSSKPISLQLGVMCIHEDLTKSSWPPRDKC